MCIIYMLFYTAFTTKEDLQIFGEMVQNIENEEITFNFCQICLDVD